MNFVKSCTYPQNENKLYDGTAALIDYVPKVTMQ